VNRRPGRFAVSTHGPAPDRQFGRLPRLGGICRDVKMIIVDPVNCNWVFASADTASLHSANAKINVLAKVLNQSTAAQNTDILVTVVDSSMATVGTATVSSSIPAGDSGDVNCAVSIGAAHLWGPDNPYLYKVFTQVTYNQTIADLKIVRIGLRYFEFNKTDGKFRLNGQVVFLRGHNRHESFPFIGRAAPNRLQRRDAELLKYDLGDNVARCSHYPRTRNLLTGAMRSDLCSSKSCPAGRPTEIPRGRTWRSITWKKWSCATGTIRPLFRGALESTNPRTTRTVSFHVPILRRTRSIPHGRLMAQEPGNQRAHGRHFRV